MHDDFRFLDPWTQLLPDRFPSVLAVAGSGGRTTLMLRLWRHYRALGRSVLWAQTSRHAPPFDLLPARCGPDPDRVARRLGEQGSAWVGGGGEERGASDGLSPSAIETLRRATRPDVLLVDSHGACGTPLRRDGVAPIWPDHTQVAFLVGSLAAVGRPWGPTTVAGVAQIELRTDGTPRRVEVDDVLRGVRVTGDGAIPAPPDALCIPFLTGLGSFRDLDGMFQIVGRLWEDPRIRAVCLAELVGDPRRDAADQAGLDARPEVGPWQGERIYAVYPAELDGGAEVESGT